MKVQQLIKRSLKKQSENHGFFQRNRYNRDNLTNISLLSINVRKLLAIDSK